MSQHITGSVGQTVQNDYGDFVTIAETRMRKDLIIAYCLAEEVTGDPRGWTNGLIITLSYKTLAIPMETKEKAQVELEKLDWIFKKEARE